MAHYRSFSLVVLCALFVGLLCAFLPSADAAASVCTAATPLKNGDAVNVAVLVWLIDQPTGVYKGRLRDTKATTIAGYGVDLIQPWSLGVDLYVEMFRAQGGKVRLPSQELVNVNFVYINLAGADGTALQADYATYYSTSTLPLFMASGTYAFATNTNPFNAYIRSTNPLLLNALFGITQPFTYIIIPPLFADDFVPTFMNNIEDSQSHVVVHSFLTAKDLFICDGLTTGSATPDCLQYNRTRRGGARRFETLFSTMFDSTMNQNAALDSFHTLGVKSVVIIREAPAASTFSKYAGEEAQTSAEQLNVDVLGDEIAFTTIMACDPAKPDTNGPNCPPYSLGSKYNSQTQIFPNDRTPDDVAAELLALNADALVILANPSSAASWTFSRLFAGMRKVGYTPKAISWGGGPEAGVTNFMEDPTDIIGTWTTKPWDDRLKGPSYKNRGSDTQFEILPANLTHDGPAVFADAFDAAFGPMAPGGQHAMYRSHWREGTYPAIGWGTMNMVQKLIEISGTLEVPSILNSAKSLSTPGVYHQVQFDQYGRTARVNEMLVQITDVDLTTGKRPLLISPYNIGSTPVFPLPTWPERVFDPRFYSEASEKIVIAVNSVLIVLCLLLVGVVLANWRTPVIRAATPSFCLLIILGGIMMLISNYFSTLVVNGSHCSAYVWFLTIGFTIIFSALFIKTFRVWKIFHGSKLQVLKMKDSELLMYVGAFVLMDIIINAAWTGAIGMDTRLVVVDVNRPSKNYLTCDYDQADGAIYTHVALKGLMLLAGVVLTWNVRNVPSSFNESVSIGVAIYNCSFVVCFIIPIISAELGGRETTFLIRAFAIMFVVTSTLCLLYIPKMMNLASANGVQRHDAKGVGSGVGTRILSSEGTHTKTGEAVKTPFFDQPNTPGKSTRVVNVGENKSFNNPNGVNQSVGGNDREALDRPKSKSTIQTTRVAGEGGAPAASSTPEGPPMRYLVREPTQPMDAVEMA